METSALIGCTIQEAMERISHKEFEVRIAYRNKYGAVDPVRMFDASGAIVASQVNNAHGGKAKPSDFMPYGQGAKEDVELSGDEFFGLISTGKNVKKGR